MQWKTHHQWHRFGILQNQLLWSILWPLDLLLTRNCLLLSLSFSFPPSLAQSPVPQRAKQGETGPWGLHSVLPVETLTQQVQAGRAVGAAGQGRKTGGWSMAGSVRQLQSMAGDSSPLSLIKHYSTSLIVLQVSSYILKELENLANLLIHFGATLKDARQENYPSLILHWNV